MKDNSTNHLPNYRQKLKREGKQSHHIGVAMPKGVGVS